MGIRMTGRILLEIALFATPFAIFYLYRLAAQDMTTKERWPLTILVAAGGVLAVGALVIMALSEPSDHGLCYQAPRYENGVYIEGRKVPCDEVVVPHSGGATSAARDLPETSSDTDAEGAPQE